jgi:pimeloyl-ACP methyl ester carboxylesterase
VKRIPHPPVVPARYRARGGAGDDYGVTDPPDWRTIGWADHLHSVEIDGRRVNYVDIGDQGDARPIVFIHGLSGQWQNWLENIPRFAQERRVIAPDLPGFGASEMPREKISIERYGRVVAELCERLDLAPAVLVGNSMGGFVAAEVAIRWPEIAERLMLVAAAGVSQADLAARPVKVGAKAIALLTTSTLAQLRPAARRPRARHWFLSVVARHPGALKADMAFEGLLKGSGRPGFEDALMANLSYDFRDRLPQIGCPTLILWGEKDAVIPVRDAERFRELIPGARKRVLRDTGHVPMVERPPTFNAELARFLEHAVEEGELEGDLDGSPERHQGASV